jgi:hypothetical protein
VAEAAAELLSELRASEHEGGSHTGVCEGRTPRRILSASPTSRVCEIAQAIVVRLDAVLLDAMRLRRAANSHRYAPGQGGKSDASERVREKRDEHGSVFCRTDVCMASGVAAWGAGWVARSPDLVKATSKITSSLLLRRRNARWSVLTLTFSTPMRDREKRRTVVRIDQDCDAELLLQRARDKVGLQPCARSAAVAQLSIGTTKRTTTSTRQGHAASTGTPASPFPWPLQRPTKVTRAAEKSLRGKVFARDASKVRKNQLLRNHTREHNSKRS